MAYPQAFKSIVLSSLGFLVLMMVFCVRALAVTPYEETTDLSIERITESEAAKYFESGDYENALREFRELLEAYPDDVTLHRYVGISQSLLGNLDDAVAEFQKALNIDPDNAALHYYLGRTYYEQGLNSKAEQELDIVLSLDGAGFYGAAAQDALVAIRKGQVSQILPKAWTLFGSLGIEADSNVIVQPDDEALRSQIDEDGTRVYWTLGGQSKRLDRGDLHSWLQYRSYYSVLSDSDLDPFDYILQEISLKNRWNGEWLRQAATYGLDFALPVGFLDDHLFTYTARIEPSVTTKPTADSTLRFGDIYRYVEVGPDGSVPDLTSRDGHYNQTSILYTRYMDNFKKYCYVGYALDFTAAQGDNFNRVGHTFRLGHHTPVTGLLKLDAEISYEFADYDDFDVTLVQREDRQRENSNWRYFVQLTHPVGPNWKARAYYQYFDANNLNDTYEYDRHIVGTELAFRY